MFIIAGPPSNVLVDYEECLTSTHLESGDQIEQQKAADAKTASRRCSLTTNHADEIVFNEEGREQGYLARRVYTTYCSAVGYGLVVVILFAVILMQVTRNSTDLWMAYWVTHTPINSTQNYLLEPSSYFGMYRMCKCICIRHFLDFFYCNILITLNNYLSVF